jgi:hypothetical protein
MDDGAATGIGRYQGAAFLMACPPGFYEAGLNPATSPQHSCKALLLQQEPAPNAFFILVKHLNW